MTADPTAPIEWHRYADGQALAAALAQAVADDLRAALGARNVASLAVSGGNTPKAFLRALSAQALDWSRVSVTLVDERWVAEDHERSNAALVRRQLLVGPAAAARFLPLYRELPGPEAALDLLERDLAALGLPLDVVVLGMGSDGHTASFFPGGDRLAEALDLAGPATVLPMRAPAAGEPRITLTLPALLAARHLYLHIEGADKQALLARAASAAAADLRYPVSAVLRHARVPVGVYWSA